MSAGEWVVVREDTDEAHNWTYHHLPVSAGPFDTAAEARDYIGYDDRFIVVFRPAVSSALAETYVARGLWAGVCVPDVAVLKGAAALSPHVAQAATAGHEVNPAGCGECFTAVSLAARVLHAGADAIAVEELRNGLDHELLPELRYETGEAAVVLERLVKSTRERMAELGGAA